jgi:hypothetical protein
MVGLPVARCTEALHRAFSQTTGREVIPLAITFNLKVLIEIVDWATDQAEHQETCEVRINFFSSEVEVYDYERGVVESTRPLPYFED